MPDEYKADFVGNPKPPKIVQRRFGPPFPGAIVVAFHYPGAAVAPGGILGFGITTTKSDSGVFAKKAPAG